MALNSATLRIMIPSLPAWAEVVLVISLAWVAAGVLVKPLMPGSGAFFSTAQEDKDYSVDIRGLLTSAPFGRPAPVKVVSKPVVKSKLAIKLLGTVVAGEESAALIKPKAGVAEEVYHIGDSIMPGVILKGVESTRILIEVSGRKEIIMLDESSPVNTRPFMSVLAGKPANTSNSLKGEMGKSSTQHLRISRAILNREMQNIVGLMSQARIIPQFKNGKSNGFLINEIVPGSIYQRLGLHNGDIIRGINGTSPSSADQAIAVLKALKEKSHVEIALMRSKFPFTIQYEIR